jgi:hypothetical protein
MGNCTGRTGDGSVRDSSVVDTASGRYRCSESERPDRTRICGHTKVTLLFCVCAGPNAFCRFRKLCPTDSQSAANQNIIAAWLQSAFCSFACCATTSSRGSSLRPRSWCCGISSMSCSSARHGDRICVGPIVLYSFS